MAFRSLAGQEPILRLSAYYFAMLRASSRRRSLLVDDFEGKVGPPFAFAAAWLGNVVVLGITVSRLGWAPDGLMRHVESYGYFLVGFALLAVHFRLMPLAVGSTVRRLDSETARRSAVGFAFAAGASAVNLWGCMAT